MSPNFEGYLPFVVSNATIYLALLCPLFVLAWLTSQRSERSRALLIFAALLTLDIALVYSFKAAPLVPHWGGLNWQGKLLELSWPLVLVTLVPRFTAETTGLTFATSRMSWVITAMLCVIYFVLNIALQSGLGARFSPHVKLPALLYQATMPGLAEEFVYRGVLLLLLDESFGRSWRFLGAQFGWALVIVSVLFGLMHGLDIHGFGIRHVYWREMLYAFVMGVILAWLRERTGSVWPCVVLHNFANVMNGFFV
jgi:uncharacterized protein